MKLNYETCLIGEKVILVPYRPEHVPRYHEWMKDPDLLEATGSEPLSLEEEVEMQQSWRDDDRKCTFIVHSNKCHPMDNSISDDTSQVFRVEEHLDDMIGDVNLFLSELECDNDEWGDDLRGTEASQDQLQQPLLQAEIDIMIAEKHLRGQGLGRAATCAMALYGVSKLGIRRLFCKINEDNKASIHLFKSIGFCQCDYAACFKQVELELVRPIEEMKEIFQVHGGSFKTIPCPLRNI